MHGSVEGVLGDWHSYSDLLKAIHSGSASDWKSCSARGPGGPNQVV